MRTLTILTFGLLVTLGDARPGRAAWGWPPPGYSVTGVRACDGARYRGLCEKWREHRQNRKHANEWPPCEACPAPAPVVLPAAPPPANPTDFPR